MVLQALFSCFERAGSVDEGLVGDFIWGFQQCGIPPALTINGLKDLQARRFIKFQAKDNSYTDFSSDLITSAFVRYQSPILQMVYESSNSGDFNEDTAPQ